MGTPRDWLSELDRDFLSVLDGLASKRISSAANRAGLKTAILPNALMDTLVMLYHGHAMFADLCRIYSLRLGAMGTVMVLAKLFLSAYAAGQIDEHEDTIASGIQAVTGLLGRAAGVGPAKVAAKAGAGLFNRVLISRIGKSAQRQLRPLAMK